MSSEQYEKGDIVEVYYKKHWTLGRVETSYICQDSAVRYIIAVYGGPGGCTAAADAVRPAYCRGDYAYAAHIHCYWDTGAVANGRLETDRFEILTAFWDANRYMVREHQGPGTSCIVQYRCPDELFRTQAEAFAGARTMMHELLDLPLAPGEEETE